jgi:pimeloyl-ACP methyl ester carboxylesterase
MSASIAGIELEWREQGEGSPILFVHGFPFNSAMWGPQLANLPKGWRGIAPDLRGFGASAGGTEDVYTMELFARDLAALLDHLGQERVVVCGLSMGGYIAFEFQRLFPERVRALVLCDTRAGADSDETRKGRERQAARVLDEGEAPVIESMLPRLISMSTRYGQPGVLELVRAMMKETPAITMARALRGMAVRMDSEPLLRTIEVPALVIVGAEDAITSRGQAEFLARGIRGARLETIENAGHLPNLEHPDTFNRLLHSFLAGLPLEVATGRGGAQARS